MAKFVLELYLESFKRKFPALSIDMLWRVWEGPDPRQCPIIKMNLSANTGGYIYARPTKHYAEMNAGEDIVRVELKVDQKNVDYVCEKYDWESFLAEMTHLGWKPNQ